MSQLYLDEWRKYITEIPAPIIAMFRVTGAIGAMVTASMLTVRPKYVELTSEQELTESQIVKK